jgi:hypothetical protein
LAESGLAYGSGRMFVHSFAAASYSQTAESFSFSPRLHW